MPQIIAQVVRTDGSTGSVALVNATDNQFDSVLFSSDAIRINSAEHGFVLQYRNKRQRAAIFAAVDALNREPELRTYEVRTQVEQCTLRRIELLRVAQEQNLNAGREWVCAIAHVDAHSLPPEWEGELICYVYPTAA